MHERTDLAKTPWVDRLFQKFLERAARAAPSPKQVPLLTSKAPVRVAEFGCGHYGCALPTNDPSVIVKVTSDPTEAAFAVIAMQGDQPEGVVRYSAAYAVPDYTYRGRPVFVLWRQAAFRVGAEAVFRGAKNAYENVALREAANMITLYRGMASVIRDVVLAQAKRSEAARWGLIERAKMLELWADDFIESTVEQSRVQTVQGAHRVAAATRVLELLEPEMENSPGAYLIGGALSHYRDIGLLLADVHLNNVGHRSEDDSPLSGIIVIDPGHAVALVPKWQAVNIPDLPA